MTTLSFLNTVYSLSAKPHLFMFVVYFMIQKIVFSEYPFKSECSNDTCAKYSLMYLIFIPPFMCYRLRQEKLQQELKDASQEPVSILTRYIMASYLLNSHIVTSEDSWDLQKSNKVVNRIPAENSFSYAP